MKDLNNTVELKKKRNKILKIKKKAAALPVPLPKVQYSICHKSAFIFITDQMNIIENKNQYPIYL